MANAIGNNQNSTGLESMQESAIREHETSQICMAMG